MKRFFRRTKKVAVAPPPANGTPNGRTSDEYDVEVEVAEARAEAALARLRTAYDAAVSAVRARRASGGHAAVKP